MKETGKDGAEYGFKVAPDGWHKIEFQDEIGFLPGKGGVGFTQDDDGFKTYKFAAKVIESENGENDGIVIDQLAGTNPKYRGGSIVANILAAVGLWDAVLKAFPGEDASVFDKPVMDGIKGKVPGTSCMVKTEIGKDGRSHVRQIASFAKYKEIHAAEKSTGGSKASTSAGSTEKAKSEVPSAVETPKGW